jgi:hypothetical protein
MEKVKDQLEKLMVLLVPCRMHLFLSWRADGKNNRHQNCMATWELPALRQPHAYTQDPSENTHVRTVIV